jgi:hypothetical protein
MAEDDAGYVYAETEVSAQVHSAYRATPDAVVAIGKTIWAEVEKSGVPGDDDAGNDALLGRLQAQYKDFTTSFPLVVRWMVQMRLFNAEALRKYLLKHAAAKLDTRRDFLELQAEYLVLLYRETHRRPDEAFVKRYREALVRQLLEEDEEFAKIQRQLKADLKLEDAALDRDRRRRLHELLASRVQREAAGFAGAGAASAGPEAGAASASPEAGAQGSLEPGE